MLAGAATAAIGSASPWYKRSSLPNTPPTFFLTCSTLSHLTHSSHSCAYSPPSSFLSTLLYCTPLTSLPFLSSVCFSLLYIHNPPSIRLHTRNPCLWSGPSGYAARGVPDQDALTRTALWSMMMKAFPSGNGCQDNAKDSGQLAQSPQVLICPSPLLGHHLMVTSLLNRREVIIQPMKDGNGERTFELGPIVTMSCHPWDSNAKVKPNQPNPPRQHPPVPSFPGEQTPRQLTPGLSGTQWLEDLFHEPSQMDEPPIPGPSPSSEPHEDVLTCEPEPEVALTQSREEPFARPTPPHSIFIIDDRLVRSPPP
ncbi:hypothetical protein O181_049680 [Austropuccinia psidii MF-1]|uniref:Uncharacterized protein n=1 Tax=Austropuccinia psidii MF-1 TaxID=1389203 RepID=A0A9Q3HQ97_9BASI|nr:hypothetical protein [Austropuccinia psidii MF-1]